MCTEEYVDTAVNRGPGDGDGSPAMKQSSSGGVAGRRGSVK